MLFKYFIFLFLILKPLFSSLLLLKEIEAMRPKFQKIALTISIQFCVYFLPFWILPSILGDKLSLLLVESYPHIR